MRNKSFSRWLRSPCRKSCLLRFSGGYESSAFLSKRQGSESKIQEVLIKESCRTLTRWRGKRDEAIREKH